MSILAKRFKTLDMESNIPTADFLSADSSDLLNSANLDAIEIDLDMEDFFANGLQLPKLELPKEDNSLVRKARGALGSIQDLSKLSPKDIDKMIGGMIPDNPMAQSAFGQLSSKCKTNGSRRLNMGKPYDPSVNCGGKKRRAGSAPGCSTSQYGNVLDKLTNGNYKAKYNDLNAVLRNLVNLSNMGYKMNMCGVFGALSGDIGKNILSRASGNLLGSLAASKNILGVFDLAGASSGLHTIRENPGGLSAVMKGVTIPKDIRQRDLGSFNDRLTGSMELFDSKWNKSRYDGMLSSSVIPGYNKDLGISLKGKVMENRINEDDLFTPRSDDNSLLAMAHLSSKVSKPSWAGLI